MKQKGCKKSSMTPRAGSLRQALVFVLLAAAAMTTASFAWFSIADRTRVHSMDLGIASGVSLRFDLQQHAAFEEYAKTLTFSEICSRASQGQGIAAESLQLEPVTTADAKTFTLEKGTPVMAHEGKYLTFPLHFMATEDMTVHLTADNSASAQDGTYVQTDRGSPGAMRIGFVSNQKTVIFEPQNASQNTFTLPMQGSTSYQEANALFTLKANTDYLVTVCIWLEGTDAECTDDMRNCACSIRLRFVGTDEKGTPLT